MQHIPGERYIEIGLQGEHYAREVRFDLSGLVDRWPQAVWRLMYRRPGDTAPYPGEITREEAVLTWHIQRRDVQTGGTGQYQLIGTQIGADGAEMLVAKSPIGTVLIHDSLGCEVPPPDAIVSWLEQIDKAAQAADASASAAVAFATQAQSSAAAAGTLAQQASNSAQLAAHSADDAADSAVVAQEHAQNAGDSATKAEQSATKAQESASAAAQSATKAQGSASAASQSAAGAQGDAGNALQSANSASTAASNASASAKAASNSAQQAASAADTARTDAATAQDAAQDAVEHASAAQKAAEAAENAAQEALGIIDDEVVARDSTWSSDSIVATLCPPFEVCGNIVQCEPVEGSPLDVTVEIVPAQEGEGDPSPDNVRPISGRENVSVTRCGVNLLDVGSCTVAPESFGLSVQMTGDVITINGTATSASQGGISFLGILNAPDTSLSGKGYKITAFPIRGSITTIYGLRTEAEISIAIGINLVVGQTVDIAMRIMVSEDTPDAYAPYTGTTATLTLPETIYGGTVDAVTGVGAKTIHRAVLDGTENWILNAQMGDSGINGYQISLGFLADDSYDCVCSHFGGMRWDGVLKEDSVAVTSHVMVVRTNGSETLEDWKSFLAAQYAAGTPVQIAYKLATPTAFQATGGQSLLALPGPNTIYADAGPVTVKGYSDPVTIINKLSSRIAALEDAQTTI